MCTVLYDFKAAAGVLRSKSDFMGHARTSPELQFHEGENLMSEIMLHVTVNAMLPL